VIACNGRLWPISASGIPGGKVEVGDADLEETARRETWEEACVGLHPGVSW
jgi:ADP-ribose pyrophosphatase YjhB (NUDIX family)